MLLLQPSCRSNYGISAVGSGIRNARRMPRTACECGQLLGYADSSHQHLGCSAGDRTAAGCAVRLPINDRNSEKQRQRSLPRPHRSERRGAGSDYTVRIYVDGAAVFYTPTSTINQYIWMPNGQHTVEMVAEDVAGYIATSAIQLNVVAQDVGATDIQDRTNWVSCSALISGSTCAARVGVAQSNGFPSIHPIIGSIGFQVQPGRKTSLLE